MNPSKNGKIDPKELVKERYSFEDLIKLIRLLRSPEGCPWDREQTHASIRKNFIEETYEVLEAIDKEDLPLLREELGDVLLQVGPVSYTHLDVYKRQVRRAAALGRPAPCRRWSARTCGSLPGVPVGWRPPQRPLRAQADGIHRQSERKFPQ